MKIMNRTNQIRVLIIICGLCLLIIPGSTVVASSIHDINVVTPVSPYVDPTTGGVLIQLLLAGGSGVLAIIALFRKRIWSWVRRSKKDAK